MNGHSMAGVGEKPVPVQGAGQHILVIAGDPATTEPLSTALESAGYLVGTARSGAEALSRLGDFRFDLVILDLALPDLDVLARRNRVTGERPAVLFLAAVDSLGALLSAMGLLVNSGKVLSKEQIARHVWGEYRCGNAIEQLVSRLRRKVNQETPALIHTRRGFGYWLGGSVP